MTSLLALYRVLKRRGQPVNEIGDLVYAMALRSVNQTPKALRRLIGRLYMSRLWRKRISKAGLSR